MKAFPKLQFLGKLLTPGENYISRKCLTYKELAILSKSILQNQPGFGKCPMLKTKQNIPYSSPGNERIFDNSIHSIINNKIVK
jgi:hypothetical protein